jgi:hypothetical protein
MATRNYFFIIIVNNNDSDSIFIKIGHCFLDQVSAYNARSYSIVISTFKHGIEPPIYPARADLLTSVSFFISFPP